MTIMYLPQFDYKLPKELIAQYPQKRREDARLMVVHRDDKSIEHRMFSDIQEYINPGDILLLNETKVVKARMLGKKEDTGGKIEVFFIREVENSVFEAFVRPRKRIRPGIRVLFNKGSARVLKHLENGHTLLEVEGGINPQKMLELCGEVPLPPYIKRSPVDLDEESYQTIYARVPGAVAAPTAGLHLSSELLQNIEKKGVIVLKILLHTGPGTFKPIKTERIEEHKMEDEYYEVREDVARKINNRCGRLFAVGTTTVRAIETVTKNGRVSSDADRTDLYIYPPYKFKVVDCLVTNFHLPKTSLLIMVSTFAGRELIMKAYNEAIRKRYKFYSYGDAMLII
ncbi:MAG: tRNA preQ1(34) S-adenosylmethionine ribosyltransferase-isomerase QueA [candidate division WOR-3 bacterium]|nr:tRNA preQ1(34) S-adenosylmethionine ribosyltransferase-isomerase QueA [candidate division WOR-3 bacterium]